MNLVHRRVARELAPPRPPFVLPSLRSLVPRDEAALVDRALPDVLETIARALRSGVSLRSAIAEAAEAAPPPLADGLDALSTAATRGRPLTVAIESWAGATPGEGVALASAALSLAAEIGGAAARSLDGVADTLRDRNGLRHEVRALSSQARASALVIALAPLAFAVVAMAADPGTAAFLVRTPLGLLCLLGGVGLDAAGGWWMRRIIRRAGRERDPVAAQQADVVDLFVLAIGAGLNLRLAVTAVAGRAPPAWSDALLAVVAYVDRGQRISDTLDALPTALGDPSRPLVRVLTSADRYGTPLLPALERLAVDARLDRRRRAEEAARRVPVALLFPLVLCVLPAFGLLTVAPLLAGALDALRL